MDLISIVVPIYNVEKYLKKCIDSIINQTYKNLEIILVDDGSPDNCPKICDDYAKLDSRIKVIHKKNGGLSDARNNGIKNSTGKYISFIDSDDYIEQNMIEELYKAIKEGSQIAICNRLEYFESMNPPKFKKSFINDKNLLIMDKKEAISELCSFRFFDMSAWAKLYKRNLFNDIQFPIGKLSEDYYIMYKLFDKCQKISYLNKPLYIYNQRQGSISKNKRINYDYKFAAEEQMNYIEDKYPDLKEYVRTAYALSNMTIFNWYVTNRRTVPSLKEYKELKSNVKNNLQYIISNKKISNNRKIQAKIFLKGRFIYLAFYILYKKL